MPRSSLPPGKPRAPAKPINIGVKAQLGASVGTCENVKFNAVRVEASLPRLMLWRNMSSMP